MWWVVKKLVFSLLNTLISTEIHFYSKKIYFAINIYFQHPPHHLKFDLDSREVLGRIYALIIEVLYINFACPLSAVGSSLAWAACDTSQVLLAGCQVFFFFGYLPFSPT